MATRTKKAERSTRISTTKANARSLRVARSGIKSSGDFKNYFSGLISDLTEGKISTNVANAACNAGGKLLKIVEMEFKYGHPKSAHRKLELIGG